MKFDKLNKNLDEINMGQVGAALGNAKQKIKSGVSNVGQNIKQGVNNMKANAQHSTQMQQSNQYNKQQAQKSVDPNKSWDHKTISDKEKYLVGLIRKFAKVIRKKDQKSIADAEKIQKEFEMGLKQYKSFKPQSEGIIESIINEIASAAVNQDLSKYFDQVLKIMDTAQPGNKDVVNQLKIPYKQIIAKTGNVGEGETSDNNIRIPGDWDQAAALMQDIINHKGDATEDPKFFDKLKEKGITKEYLEKWKDYIKYDKGTPDQPNPAYTEALKRINDAEKAIGGEESTPEGEIDPENTDDVKSAADKKASAEANSEDQETKDARNSQIKTAAKKLHQTLLKTNRTKRDKYMNVLNRKLFANQLKISGTPMTFNDLVKIVGYVGDPTQAAKNESFEEALFSDQILYEAIKLGKEIVL